MRTLIRSDRNFPVKLPFILLCLFLVVLWLAGGASRADVPGQVIVRSIAWIVAITAILLGSRPSIKEARPVAYLLGAAVVLVVLQLAPVPPALWQALPGRAMFAEIDGLAGQPEPWRPLAIVPGAALNALSSLIIPSVTFLLLVLSGPAEKIWLVRLVLSLILAAAIIGLLQISGVRWNNPLINDAIGQVSGTFANRNHFAVFLAFGCLLAPVWAFLEGDELGWRGPVALFLLLLFVLTILASGSRAGMVLGLLALVIGFCIVRHPIRKALSYYPRWVFPILLLSVVVTLALFVLIASTVDRTVSIERIMDTEVGDDLRGRALPTIIGMTWKYFPAGSGLGSFDQIFRMHEPFGMLRQNYFNHAHNDLLQIILEAGLPGLLLITAGAMWWLLTSLRVWRGQMSSSVMLGRVGSAMLLLVFMASAFDYPARTPMMMAMIVLAGLWLNWGANALRRPALPA